MWVLMHDRCKKNLPERLLIVHKLHVEYVRQKKQDVLKLFWMKFEGYKVNEATEKEVNLSSYSLVRIKSKNQKKECKYE